MDALRKAEESKKKAEQEQKPDSTDSGAAALESSKTKADTASTADTEQVSIDLPEVNPSTSSASSFLPDIQLEFEDSDDSVTVKDVPAPQVQKESPGEKSLQPESPKSRSGSAATATDSAKKSAGPKTSLADIAAKYSSDDDGVDSSAPVSPRRPQAQVPVRSKDSAPEIKQPLKAESATKAEPVVKPSGKSRDLQQTARAKASPTNRGDQSTSGSTPVARPKQAAVTAKSDPTAAAKKAERPVRPAVTAKPGPSENGKEPAKAEKTSLSIAPLEQVKSETEKNQEKVSDRNSARSVFSAKRGRPGSGRMVKVVVSSVAAMLVAGTGAYFYFSLNQAGGIGVTPVNNEVSAAASPLSASPQSSVVTAAPIISEPEPAVVTQSTQSATDAASLSNPQPSGNNSRVISQIIGEPEASAAADELEPGTAAIAAVEITSAVSADIPALANSEPAAATLSNVDQPPVEVPAITATSTSQQSALASSPAELEPTNLISFTRRQSVSTIDPLVRGAYGAYQRGNLDEARRLYQQTLVNSPRHRDALLGLAAIAVSDNESIVAMDLYSRLLARDPSDPVAQAGLLELTPSGSPGQQELEIKRLLERHPNVAPLVYALGSFYASQSRWTEAQQAYFKAMQLAKADALLGGQVNPDYAYNLAVSLEHLDQLQPAQNFYQEALDLAASYPASFDLDIVRRRLESIGGTSTR